MGDMTANLILCNEKADNKINKIKQTIMIILKIKSLFNKFIIITLKIKLYKHSEHIINSYMNNKDNV